MKKKTAINGMGRIGRAVFKLILESDKLEVVEINDLVPAENLAYLLKYDTVYGRYGKGVAAAPVAGPETVSRLEGEADEVVVVEKPEFFRAVAQSYRNWYDVPDREVIEILADRNRERT